MVEFICLSILKIAGTVVAICFGLFLVALMILGLYTIIKETISAYVVNNE